MFCFVVLPHIKDAVTGNDFISIACGVYGSCATRINGSIGCWGSIKSPSYRGSFLVFKSYADGLVERFFGLLPNNTVYEVIGYDLTMYDDGEAR